MKISYGLTTNNEGMKIHLLIREILESKKDYDYEIVILDDYSDNQTTQWAFKEHKDKIRLFKSKLSGNFAAHKNLLNSYCTGDYIVNIDADETFYTKYMYENIDKIIKTNPDIELFWVPRINIVKGITEEIANGWRWSLSKLKGIDEYVINFPDWQGRIYKNIPSKIMWTGKVHEKIIGAEKFTFLPKTNDFCLYHPKDINRQIKQNKFYEGFK